eukprot:scpid31640/ scgid35422/ 
MRTECSSSKHSVVIAGARSTFSLLLVLIATCSALVHAGNSTDGSGTTSSTGVAAASMIRTITITKSLHVFENDTVSLQCDVDSDSLVDVVWMHAAYQFDRDRVGPLTTLTGNGHVSNWTEGKLTANGRVITRSVLTVLMVGPSDTGLFACFATTNKTMFGFTTAVSKFNESAEAEDLVSDDTIADNGDVWDFYIYCNGNWSRSTVPTCDSPFAIASTSLHVLFAPRITTDLDLEYAVPSGECLTLSCAAFGSPPPLVLWSTRYIWWTGDGIDNVLHTSTHPNQVATVRSVYHTHTNLTLCDHGHDLDYNGIVVQCLFADQVSDSHATSRVAIIHQYNQSTTRMSRTGIGIGVSITTLFMALLTIECIRRRRRKAKSMAARNVDGTLTDARGLSHDTTTTNMVKTIANPANTTNIKIIKTSSSNNNIINSNNSINDNNSNKISSRRGSSNNTADASVDQAVSITKADRGSSEVSSKSHHSIKDLIVAGIRHLSGDRLHADDARRSSATYDSCEKRASEANSAFSELCDASMKREMDVQSSRRGGSSMTDRSSRSHVPCSRHCSNISLVSAMSTDVMLPTIICLEAIDPVAALDQQEFHSLQLCTVQAAAEESFETASLPVTYSIDHATETSSGTPTAKPDMLGTCSSLDTSPPKLSKALSVRTDGSTLTTVMSLGSEDLLDASPSKLSSALSVQRTATTLTTVVSLGMEELEECDLSSHTSSTPLSQHFIPKSSSSPDNNIDRHMGGCRVRNPSATSAPSTSSRSPVLAPAPGTGAGAFDARLAPRSMPCEYNLSAVGTDAAIGRSASFTAPGQFPPPLEYTMTTRSKR